jgi:methylated-DNA-[protein]-cysteine S-methyltransferase
MSATASATAAPTTAPSSLAWSVHQSPIGPLTALATPAGLRALHFEGQAPPLDPVREREMPVLAAQLAEFFAGERNRFELPLDLRGDPLGLAVWTELRTIAYGETTSYGELTARLDPTLFRATMEPWQRVRQVGTEIGRTPTPVVVPCHRVVGADGSLTGYGGGLDRKRILLAIESGVTTLC